MDGSACGSLNCVQWSSKIPKSSVEPKLMLFRTIDFMLVGWKWWIWSTDLLGVDSSIPCRLDDVTAMQPRLNLLQTSWYNVFGLSFQTTPIDTLIDCLTPFKGNFPRRNLVVNSIQYHLRVEIYLLKCASQRELRRKLENSVSIRLLS